MNGAVIEKDLLLKSSMSTSVDRILEGDTLPKNLICFSHLRWDFVFQRPQHILTRLSDTTVVHFIEEPIFGSFDKSFWVISKRSNNIWVCVPHMNAALDPAGINLEMKVLLDVFFAQKDSSEFIFWYYTPMAVEFTDHLVAGLTVYDCMDELSAFKFAPERIKSLERTLLQKSDIVFTGGHSLFKAKKELHENMFPFPSSIDKKHFVKGRQKDIEPADQANIKGPKIGFYGVIDERLDIGLIEALALQRPDWNIILIGPVVKIDAGILPRKHNIHYLGPKPYDELPAYLAGWDVAIVPFVIDESTRFVSPTKTPEYLSAGKPVVSTPIEDIVDPYGKNLLVSIAKDADEFIKSIDYWLNCKEKNNWQYEVDKFLLTISWDITCSDMRQLMLEAYTKKKVFQFSNSNAIQNGVVAV